MVPNFCLDFVIFLVFNHHPQSSTHSVQVPYIHCNEALHSIKHEHLVNTAIFSLMNYVFLTSIIVSKTVLKQR